MMTSFLKMHEAVKEQLSGEMRKRSNGGVKIINSRLIINFAHVSGHAVAFNMLLIASLVIGFIAIGVPELEGETSD